MGLRSASAIISLINFSVKSYAEGSTIGCTYSTARNNSRHDRLLCRYTRCRRLLACQLFTVSLALHNTRTRWDQFTYDHIFFQTHQMICLSLDRCLRQYTRGFLEGRRRQEAMVLSEALVTPSRTVWAVAGSPPSAKTRALVSS